MYAAVSGWSPVIMTGRMPAATQVATASRASGRGGSRMPTSPTKVRSFSMFWWVLSSGSPSSRRNPTPSTRIPSLARRSFARTIRDVHSSSSRSLAWPTHTCREMPMQLVDATFRECDMTKPCGAVVAAPRQPKGLRQAASSRQASA